MREKRNGFTLLELLVVVAIIGLLASIVLVGVSKARQNARDAKRQADVMSLVTGIELYYNANSKYPLSNCTVGNMSCFASSQTKSACGSTCACTSENTEGWAGCLLGTDIAPTSPQDPLENQGLWRYAYKYDSGRSTYNIDYYPDDLPTILAKTKCPDGFQKSLDANTRKCKCIYSPKKL